MSGLSPDPILAALPYPTIIIGAGQDIEVANALAVELLGDEILHRPFVSVLRQPKLVAAIEGCQASGAAKNGEYTTTVGHGDVVYDVQIAPLEDRVILTFVDRSDALDLDRFRHEFVANVSHELRTPLSSIIGFIETLRGPAKDDEDARNRFMKIMQTEAERMASLVDDLLSLSRVEETQRKRPTDAVVVADIVAQTITEMQPVIDASAASVSIVTHSGESEVLADANQLRQVIANLVENAVRYGAEQGAVTVSISAPTYETRLRQDGIRICVSDHGKGIAAHHIPRLTERFYRVDSHRSREAGGTGLGLAIVKHIVHRHRGHLHIESTLGEGSTFTVVLPVISEK